MCALFPPYFAGFGWPLENPISHHQHDYIYRDSDIIIEESPVAAEPQAELDRSASFSGNSSGNKKLFHNACERDRRKKINTMYLALRSLLPAPDQTKKLSIPATVSRVLKYIPELQQQVERSIQKKEELLMKISKQGDIISHQKQQRKFANGRISLASISANRLSDMEILIHISSNKVHKCPLLSEILLNLEEDGLFLLNAASFESLDGRVFYNLHLQVERTYELDCEILSEKLQSLHNEKREELFPPNLGCKN